MKGVSHGKRLKPCNRTSGVGERSLASKPGEANRRAAAGANPIEPRNTKMRVASVSDDMKPALWQQPTVKLPQTLRGYQGQRDGTEELGTWDHPIGARGVSRVQRACQRSNKLGCYRWEVGEAHSSDEAGESQWSEGALAPDKLTEKQGELIGR